MKEKRQPLETVICDQPGISQLETNRTLVPLARHSFSEGGTLSRRSFSEDGSHPITLNHGKSRLITLDKRGGGGQLLLLLVLVLVLLLVLLLVLVLEIPCNMALNPFPFLQFFASKSPRVLSFFADFCGKYFSLVAPEPRRRRITLDAPLNYQPSTLFRVPSPFRAKNFSPLWRN
jgi:hypothetical protein